MINYTQELENFDEHIKIKSITAIQSHLNELKHKLMRTEQYQEVCHVYFLKMTYYFWNGQTLRALKIYLVNRTFIEQYASKAVLVNMRYATCLLLDTLGFYKDNFATMVELQKEAVALDLPDLNLDTLNNLGYYCELEQRYDEAKKYYNECITFYEAKPGIKKSAGYLLSILNITHVYLKEQNREMAQHFLAKFEQVADQEVIFTKLIYLARKIKLFMLTDELDKAQQEADIYLSLDLESMEYHLVLGHLATIVELYERVGATKKVIEVLERSLRYASKLKDQSIRQYSMSLFQAVQESDLLDDLKKDALTGALTRRSFETYVSPMLGLRETMVKVFAIIDVDYFKQINDQYGHLMGDEILKTITSRANRYKHSNLQNGKQIFGRYGGDEFYIFFEVPTTKQAEEILQDFHKHLTAGDYRTENLIIPMSVTIGATYSTATTYTFEQWLKQADNLLYEAKNQQRGILVMQEWKQNDRQLDQKCCNDE